MSLHSDAPEILMVDGYGQGTGGGRLVRSGSFAADDSHLLIVVAGLSHLDVDLGIGIPELAVFTKFNSEFDGITHDQVGAIPGRFNNVGHVVGLNGQAKRPCSAPHVNQLSGLIYSLVPGVADAVEDQQNCGCENNATSSVHKKGPMPVWA